jgi:hypothetical protein
VFLNPTVQNDLGTFNLKKKPGFIRERGTLLKDEGERIKAKD